MNCTGANKDHDLHIIAVCEKAGKSLAFSRVSIMQGSKLIADGRHTKYVGGQKDKEILGAKFKL